MKYANINGIFSAKEVKPSSRREIINLSFLTNTRDVSACVHVHKDGHMISWNTVKTHALSITVFLK